MGTGDFAFLPRFHFDGRPAAGERVELEGEEAHHALRVRRLRPGDRLALIDGEGYTARGLITGLTTRGLALTVEETAENLNELPWSITLNLALIKSRRFEQALAMAVELGVGAVRPLLSERVVNRPAPGQLAEHLERWRRIVREETKLCERSRFPTIHQPRELPDALADDPGAHRVLLVPRHDVPALDRLVAGLHLGEDSSLSLFIGPEGDFTPAELDTARNAGCHFAGLGRRLLRSEVAAVTAVVAALVGLGAFESHR